MSRPEDKGNLEPAEPAPQDGRDIYHAQIQAQLAEAARKSQSDAAQNAEAHAKKDATVKAAAEAISQGHHAVLETLLSKKYAIIDDYVDDVSFNDFRGQGTERKTSHEPRNFYCIDDVAAKALLISALANGQKDCVTFLLNFKRNDEPLVSLDAVLREAIAAAKKHPELTNFIVTKALKLEPTHPFLSIEVLNLATAIKEKSAYAEKTVALIKQTFIDNTKQDEKCKIDPALLLEKVRTCQAFSEPQRTELQTLSKKLDEAAPLITLIDSTTKALFQKLNGTTRFYEKGSLRDTAETVRTELIELKTQLLSGAKNADEASNTMESILSNAAKANDAADRAFISVSRKERADFRGLLKNKEDGLQAIKQANLGEITVSEEDGWAMANAARR